MGSMEHESSREHALSVARQMGNELATAGGAKAVVLVGSHARGDASPDSDLDLLAVGDESYSWRLDRREGFLVSVGMRPFAAYLEAFTSPELVCASVPGWRAAVVLHDPEGFAGSLIQRARRWTWAPLERRCDAWVAEKITGYAEEVHKLVTALGGGRRSTAAVQRSLLAVRLAPILAVHRRLLYDTENLLWGLVGDAMGEEWREAQSITLGLGGEEFEAGCAAALKMYGLAVAEVSRLLDERQRRVVRHACILAGYPLSG
jgi:Nucleotidyltransferase domain